MDDGIRSRGDRLCGFAQPRGTARALLLCCVLLGSGCSPGSALPEALSDRDFWSLSEALSEPAGKFDVSDNFVSNEPGFVENVRRLRHTGGVYIGVGPEQNYSYIARLRPAMAFIIDIRRDNRTLHLLYKALFELSTDRVDFVSRLFSRPRPEGLHPAASVEDIFSRFERVPASLELYNWNVSLVREWLLTTHGFELSQSDADAMGRAFKAFYTAGPEIHFWGERKVDELSIRPSYRQLMTARDAMGQRRSFLATDEAFTFVKELHARNMIVPVVGDFAGASAIRRVGEYIRERGALVDAFYASNVGVYLTGEQTRAFCANLGTLPSAPRAAFIERHEVRPLTKKLADCAAPR